MPSLAQHPASPRLLSGPFTTLAAALSLQAAVADEITLRNGSRLVGEVVSGDNGTLGFKTDFAGTLKVDWKEVVNVRTDKPIEVLMTDDTILEVNEATYREDGILVDGDALPAPVVLKKDDVEVLNPEPWRKGQGGKFSGHANVALQTQRGNTDKDEMDLDADMTYRRKNDRFVLFAELEREEAENQKVEDDWKIEGTYNYFVSEQWFWGGFARLEHDQFADLDLRTTAGPLVGYQWFESKAMNLSTSVGVSYVDEDYISAEDDDYFAIPWNINFDRLLLDEFMQLYFRQTGFWSLEELSDVVIDTWTGLRFPLILGLVASTELKVEYDGAAAPGADKTDTTVSLKLGYQW